MLRSRNEVLFGEKTMWELLEEGERFRKEISTPTPVLSLEKQAEKAEKEYLRTMEICKYFRDAMRAAWELEKSHRSHETAMAHWAARERYWESRKKFDDAYTNYLLLKGQLEGGK